ncbi:MAG TPA: ABC transporter permease subunit [Gemmatimonadaceae bacterium]
MLNFTVMWLTWRQLFARRRVWYAVAFALAPFLFTLVFRVVADDGDASRVGFYQALCREVVIGTLLPIAGVVFGTTAFGGEVDDGTLVYLLVKPLARWQVVLSKYVVATVSTYAIAVPAIVLPWLAVRNPELSPRVVSAFLIAAGVASAIYCALFLALGLATKRALVGGLLYVIGFEGVLSRQLTGVRALSIREYAVAVSQAASDGTIVVPGSITISTVKWMGTIMLVGAIAWTMRRLVRYEAAEHL